MLNLFKRIQNLTVFKIFLILTNAWIIIIVIFFYNKTLLEKVSDADDIAFEEDELSCHYLKDEGALRALDDLVKFQQNSIFFIESSCQGLTSRQACSVESAARAHPQKQIVILFTAPVPWKVFKNSGLSTLLSLVNVEAARIHIEEYAKGTPFYNVLNKKPLSRDDVKVNIGDILKFITMYKYSGIYLGLDVIVARPLDDLKENWIVKETPASVSSEMFAFSKNKNGRALADISLNIILSDLSLTNRQDLWTFDNSNIMRQLVDLWCTTNDIMDLTSSSCKDLQVHEPDLFVPIRQHDRNKYFQQGEWSLLKNETIYTFYTWGYLTKFNMVPKNSLYDKLAEKYCPAVFDYYGVQFGAKYSPKFENFRKITDVCHGETWDLFRDLVSTDHHPYHYDIAALLTY